MAGPESGEDVVAAEPSPWEPLLLTHLPGKQELGAAASVCVCRSPGALLGSGRAACPPGAELGLALRGPRAQSEELSSERAEQVQVPPSWSWGVRQPSEAGPATPILEMETEASGWLTSGAQQTFCTGPGSKRFRLWRLCGLGRSDSTLLSEGESGQTTSAPRFQYNFVYRNGRWAVVC